MRPRTRDVARGKWHGILAALGIDPSFLKNRHGSCPVCGGTDRFRFDDKDGTGSFFCSQCGSGDGFKLAQLYTGKNFQTVAAEIDKLLMNEDIPTREPAPAVDPAIRLRAIYRQAMPAKGSINPATLYLQSRGISLVPDVTQWVKRMRYWEDGKALGDYPAMVHMIHDADGKPCTYQVQYLTNQGRKAPVACPRKVLTPKYPWKGGYIPLFKFDQVVGVCEGLETALSAHQLTGIPTIPLISADNLVAFEPPPGVTQVHIFSDRDDSYTGQACSFALARRLKNKGLAVKVHMPDTVGDFNDQLRGEV